MEPTGAQVLRLLFRELLALKNARRPKLDMFKDFKDAW